MRKINKNHMRTGLAILIFSLIITALFTLAMIMFHNKVINTALNSTGTLYQLSNEEIEMAVLQKSAVKIQESRLISTMNYQNEQFMHASKILLPYALSFLIFLFITSLIFWKYLRYTNDKEAKRLAENFDFIVDNGSSDIENETLAKVHEKISKKFKAQIEDNNRLYAYLTHEQKNAISILRTTMELDEQSKLASELGDLSDSIDDVLTLSESEDNSHLEIVDVSLICAEVCDKYKRVADNIFFEFDEECETDILAKPRWIHRAVCNLLDNAVKYGEEKPITVSVKNKHNSVIISVQDFGVGIPEEMQERIFNHNYRVNELNKDGYGIGLSLVSHVCDLCNGFVLTESTLENGTIFYIAFPAV